MEPSTIPTQTEPKKLPGTGELIVDSWNFFKQNWNEHFKTSRLLLLVGGLYFVSGLLAHLQVPGAAHFIILSSIGGSILTLWITIRVWLTTLRLEQDPKNLAAPDESKRAWTLFFPLIWISILTVLVVLGSMLLFIIPGIYFGTALYFSTLILIEQNLHGSQALAASRALVKGRWWATFGRVLLGSIVFSIPMGIITGILLGLLSRIANIPVGTSDTPSSLGYGVSQFVQMLMLGAFLPLMTGFQLKIYRALQKTR